MSGHLETGQTYRLWVVAADGPSLGSEQDAIDLIGEAWAEQANVIVVPTSRLSEDFFRLRTRQAGEFIQKIINYQLKVVILGDIAAQMATSEALRDFVREANRGDHVFFLPDRATLAAKLGSRSGT